VGVWFQAERQLTVRLDAGLKRALEALAEVNNRTLSDEVRVALAEWARKDQ
jgi:predicted transcriptional regulator